MKPSRSWAFAEFVYNQGTVRRAARSAARVPSVNVAQTIVIKQEISKWRSPVNYLLIFLYKMQLRINTYSNGE